MTAHYFLGNRLLGTGRAYWDDITPLRESLALFYEKAVRLGFAPELLPLRFL